MRTLKPWFIGFAVISSGICGCGSDGKDGANGAAGADALVVVTAVNAGTDCTNGGSKVQFGIDANNNHKLDADEVDGTNYLCNGKDGANGTDGKDGKDGADGTNALITSTPEDPGENCPNGGQRIEEGLDANADGSLDSEEILSTNYVCNGTDGTDGTDGLNARVSVVPEAQGPNCATGGIAVKAGIDADGNGTLDTSEVTATSYVCDGADGVDGKDGLVNVTSESAGANCATGGVRVDFGADDDDNGTLDSAEIDGTRYVCNGAAGTNGQTSLVNVTAEGAGANCATGGQKIQVGLDANSDSSLGAGEVSQTQYVCNGAAGTNGHDARIVITDIAPGATCSAGGKQIDVGVDTSDDGTLQNDEISQTSVVCSGVNGLNGLASLVAVTTETAGANCAAGGKKLEFGLDADADGTLDANEVTDTEYTCNGAAGENGTNGGDGEDGAVSLVSSTAEPAGANCAHGGQHIVYGLDANDDGVLDAGEIGGEGYSCNGANGSNGTNGSNGHDSLVTVVPEAAGANCANGGQLISYGIDDDRNGMLAAGEVDGTRYVCNGATGNTGSAGTNGLNSLVNVVPEAAGANCATAGDKITWGIDDNKDGTLQAGEVDGTRYVCNGAAGTNGTAGANGSNSLVNVVPEAAGANCATGGDKITWGIDDSNDGTLQAGEVDGTRYVCNGAAGTAGSNGTAGKNSLVVVTAESIGANCAAGGQRIQSGIDADNSGTLTGGEITSTSYVCNGAT